MTDTTPAQRVTAYLDARRRFPVYADQMAECKIGGQDWTYLTETDLRAVLADNERLWAERAAWRSIGGADELEAERNQLRADLARAESEVAQYAAADSTDAAAGSYAGGAEAAEAEVERLAAQTANFGAWVEDLERERDQARRRLAEAKAGIAGLTEELAKQRETNRQAGRTFKRGLEQRSADLAEANRQLAEARAELTALKDCRPRGRSATHPPHKWMSARRVVQCAGVGVVAEESARDGAERGQEEPHGPATSNGTTQAATEPPVAAGKPAPYGRGKCTECGQTKSLTKSGVLRQHKTPRRFESVRPAGECDGSGQPPKEEPIKP